MGIETAVAAPAIAEGASKGAEAGAGAGGAAKGAEAATGGGLLAPAAEAGAGAGAAGAPLDLLAGGAGAFTPAAVGEVFPASGALASGLATEPAFASSVTGAFAPGLDTAAGLGVSGGSGSFSAFDPGSGGLDLSAKSAVPGGPNALDNVAAGGTPSGASAQSVSGLPGVSNPLSLDPTAAANTGAPANAGAAGGQAVGGTAPAAGATPAQSGGLSLDKLVSGVESSITKNPLGIAAGIGGLGYSVIKGQEATAATKKIQDQAASLNAQGQQLASYLQSGDLPPGLKSQLTQATAGAKAAVISNFAKQGMSTDPSKNSALAQQLAQIDQQAIITTASIGQSLLTTGINESGMASDLFKTLSNIDQTQTAMIGKSIAAMAAAFGGGGPKIQIGGSSS